MQKEALTPRQAAALIVLFLLSGGMTLGIRPAGQTSWLFLLAAAALAVPLYWIYAKVLTLFPGKNFFDILEVCFGKTVGKVLIFLFAVYAGGSAVLSLRHFTEGAALTTLRDTPQLFVGLCTALTAVFLVWSGLCAMGKGARVILFFTVISLLLTVLLSARLLNFDNLTPVLEGQTWSTGLMSMRLYWAPFGDGVLLLCVFSHIRKTERRAPLLLGGLGAAAALLMIILLRDVLLLGGAVYSTVYNPSYAAVSAISVLGFVQHLEVIDSAMQLLYAVLRGGICLYVAAKGLTRVFHITRKPGQLLVPLAVLTALLSAGLWRNTAMLTAAQNAFAVVTLPMQIIPPVLTLFAGLKKQRETVQKQLQSGG